MLEKSPRLGAATVGPLVGAVGLVGPVETVAQAERSVAPSVRTMRSRTCPGAKFIIKVLLVGVVRASGLPCRSTKLGRSSPAAFGTEDDGLRSRALTQT